MAEGMKHGMRQEWGAALAGLAVVLAAMLPATARAQGNGAAPDIIEFTPALINLVAGGHGAGYSGDGGLATAAQLSYPTSSAYDSNGNLYFTDQGNYVVRMINPAGVVTTVAGSGAWGYSSGGGIPLNASFGALTGLAIDTSNNVYFSDVTNSVVWELSNTGVLTVFAGVGTAGYAGDEGPASAAYLNNPYGLAFDSKSDLYIADTSNNVVRMVTPNGNIHTFAGNGIDANFDLGVGLNPCAQSAGNGGPATAATMCHPMGVAVDNNGNVYIAENGASHFGTASGYGNVVRIVTTDGNIHPFAGTGSALQYTLGPGGTAGDGGPAANADLLNPFGLWVNPGGDVYIATLQGVRMVDVSGNINTMWGPIATQFSGCVGSGDTGVGGGCPAPTNGSNFLTMDQVGDIVLTAAGGEIITSAGAAGEYTFPNQQIYTTSSVFYELLTNPTNWVMNFDGVPVVTGPFAIATGGAAGTCNLSGALAPGATCTIGITFSPTADQVYHGSIELNANSTAPNYIYLNGKGIGVAYPSATLAPSLNFSTPVGVASGVQQVTLTNTGLPPITPGAISFTVDTTHFAEVGNNCPTSLAANQSCEYFITFTPTAATSYLGYFWVNIPTYTDLWVALNGTGTSAPAAALTPLAVNFPNTPSGITASPIAVTLNNSGTATLSGIAPTITGANAANFAIKATTCGGTLAAGASCSINLTFSPNAVGAFAATLSVSDNAAGSPQAIPLTGAGTVAPPVQMNISEVIHTADTPVLTPAIQLSITERIHTTDSTAPHITNTVVPNLVGLTESSGLSAIATADLAAGFVTPQHSTTVPTGTIISQSPSPGTVVPINSPVNIVFSTGPGLTPQLTWNAPAEFTYGHPLTTAQLNAKALYNGTAVAGTFQYQPALGTILGAGTSTLQVTFTPDNFQTYTSASTTVQITVKPALLNITATNKNMTYGGSLPTFTYTAWGFVNGDTEATVLTGSPTFGTTGSSSSPTGQYPISIAPGTLAAGNYSLVFTNGVMTINPAKLRVTASFVSLPYASLIPVNFNYTVTGFVNGDTQATATSGAPLITTNATIASTVGIYPISCTAGSMNSTNYTINYFPGILRITKATPQMNWVTPAPIPYGTALGAIQQNASSPIPGNFGYLPAPGTLLAAGNHTLTVNFTPNDTADYTTAKATIHLLVTPAAQTINFTTPAAPVVYGVGLISLTASATSGLPVKFTVVSGPATVIGAKLIVNGAGTIVIAANQAGNSNYQAAPENLQPLIVTLATPLITWNPPAAITHGKALNSTQLNARSNVGGTFAYSPPAGTVLAAGQYTLTATFTPNNTTNYTTVVARVPLTVN